MICLRFSTDSWLIRKKLLALRDQIFKQKASALNPVSQSWTGCLNKAKDPILSYVLTIAERGGKQTGCNTRSFLSGTYLAKGLRQVLTYRKILPTNI